jgi:hypothetical protein
LKIRGKAFLKEIFLGFQTRLSGTINLMRKICCFSADKFAMAQFSSGDFPLPFFPQDHASLAVIEEKSKQLKAANFSESSTESFWCAIHDFRDASGQLCFQPLSNGVIRMLCLPISNAEVERVFSQVNLVKNCQRSLMKGDLLEAILYCKFGLSKLGKSASEFQPTAKMLMFDSLIYN